VEEELPRRRSLPQSVPQPYFIYPCHPRGL